MECKPKNTDRIKTIMLIVTNSCNLNCIYCYESHKAKRFMPFPLAKASILDNIIDKDYDHISIEFMGGEPLLNFELIKQVSEWLWDSDIDAPYNLFASTNGTCLTTEMKEWFYAHKHQIELGLSFDGTPFVQDINRTQSSQTIDIDFFLNTWKMMSVKMTISTLSIGNLFDSIIYLEQKGIHHIKADLAFMEGWNAEHLKIFSEQIDKLIEYYVYHRQESHCSLLQIEIENIFAQKVSTKRCGCGEDLICIDCDGKKYPCQMFAPLSMSRQLYDSVRDIDFSNEKYFLVNQCKDCVLHVCCPSCYGCNLKYNGALNKINQFYCKAFMILFLKNIEYRVAMAHFIEDEHEREETIMDLEQIAETIQIN